MSRPRYYWFRIVRMLAYQYPDKLDKKTIMGKLAYNCIRSALEDTEKLIDGEERTRLLNMTLFKRTHRTYEAALVLHVSESTAKRWISQFVYLVARKMGYI